MTAKTRSDYKICPYCGASLDVGEVCDCLQKKHATERPRTHETGQGHTNTHRRTKAA